MSAPEPSVEVSTASTAGLAEPSGETDTTGTPVPVLLVGLHGHGRAHLRSLRRLGENGLVRLVGVCDSRPLDPGDDLEGHGPVPFFTDLDRAIDETGARITVLVTPIHTHLPLARIALEHGSHLLLEKPTTATLAEFEQLNAAVTDSGLACQVGFQSLGSEAVDTVRRMIADGLVGRLRGIGGTGTWERTSAYYDRAPWAGRRRMDGRDVVDGALTNPFAHAVATALALDGAGAEAPQDVELELYRAHPIESDDTSCLRLRTAEGTTITIAVTLCAPESLPPRLIVHGERGRIELDYTLDRITLHRPGQAPVTTVHPRAGLLENLVDHLCDGTPLLVPPVATRGFMHVLEAVRDAPDPVPIPLEHQRVWEGDGGTHRTVEGINGLVHRSAESLALFSELGPVWSPASGVDPATRTTPTTKTGSAPMAASPTPSPTASLARDGTTLADLRDGTDIAPDLSPRPYLHPVRTLGGTVVTEHLPDDHRHHLGVGVAVPDVSGTSFWGGSTFTLDRGSVLLDNHGRQNHVSWPVREADHLVELLSWTDPGGTELLRERRSTRALALDSHTWVLDLRVELDNTSGRDLSIGSPATNGRPGAGYGGLFWRAPLGSAPPETTGAGGLRGEEALHGSRADWLALAGTDSTGAGWTLVFLQPGPHTDPWFLRADEYPGVGPALAWDTRLPLPGGASLERRLRVAVCDGHAADRESLARAVAALG